MARLDLGRESETPMGEFNQKRENAGDVRNQSAQVAGFRVEARFDLKEVWDVDEFHPTTTKEDAGSARPGPREREVRPEPRYRYAPETRGGGERRTRGEREREREARHKTESEKQVPS